MVGLTPGAQFRFSVYAIDNYFTGNITDAIENMTYTLSTPAFTLGGGPRFVLPAGARSRLDVSSVSGGGNASPSQTGFLLLYRDSQPSQEADAITLFPRERGNGNGNGNGNGHH